MFFDYLQSPWAFQVSSRDCSQNHARRVQGTFCVNAVLLRDKSVSEKSVKRFLDKNRGKQRNLEHHFDWVEMGYALVRQKSLKVLKLPTDSFFSTRTN